MFLASSRDEKCINLYGSLLIISLTNSIHRFPNKTLDRDRYAQWVGKCRRVGVPSKWALVCSAHFSEECMDRTGNTVRVRPGSIPTIFELPPRLQVFSLSLLTLLAYCFI